MENFKIDNEYALALNQTTGYWDTYQNGSLLTKQIDKLFKFYSLNLYNVEALLNHYFYLSDPGSFNDPFDCNINLLGDFEGRPQLKSVKRNIYKNIGITSFSETIDNHLMWAHYTNNYNGWALEFKGDGIDIGLNKQEIGRHTLTRVIYPELPPKVLQAYPFAQHYVLTTKMKNWAYEKEWRIIADLLTDNRNLKFMPDCLKAIYIGHNIPDTNKSAYSFLLEIQEIKFPTVPIYVVYPHPTELKLIFERVWN